MQEDGGDAGVGRAFADAPSSIASGERSRTSSSSQRMDGGFPRLEAADEALPPLRAPGAQPTARDRYERLVTRLDLETPAETVWTALTDPAALQKWLAVCHGSLADPDADCLLDFEDGEFFLCSPQVVEPPTRLEYLWRWLGIGQATSVQWHLDQPEDGDGTRVTVTEEAINPPWDWQTWNGGGWPEILDQLGAYLRTGTAWRWPWRRMGPYAQIELPVSLYDAWDRLFRQEQLKYWLLVTEGELAADGSMTILMGDASGMLDMHVHEVVQPGQSPPSFLPHVSYSLHRSAWDCHVGGRLWIEPAGWGRSLLQAFHYNWENLPAGLQLSERRILTSFWADAMRRAQMLCGGPSPTMPHNW